MQNMEWKPIYSVGVREIDEQHKALILLLNKLMTAMSEGKGKDVLSPVLSELIRYTDYHFKTEEAYFKKLSFPGGPAHVAEHDSLRNKARRLQEDHDQGKVLLTMEVMKFLVSWVDQHILLTDKQYTSFFEQNGIK